MERTKKATAPSDPAPWLLRTPPIPCADTCGQGTQRLFPSTAYYFIANALQPREMKPSARILPLPSPSKKNKKLFSKNPLDNRAKVSVY
jgi:hypothetical protein